MLFIQVHIENLFILGDAVANKLSMCHMQKKQEMDLDVVFEKTCGDNVVKISPSSFTTHA